MDNTQDTGGKKYRCISTCTGYRGLEIGLEMAGVECETLAYVEIEAFAISNLVSAMEKGAIPSVPVWSNIKTFNATPFRGYVDLVTGGYPCQPFSNSGRRKGIKDPRHLWPYLERLIKAAKPFRCFFENVEGHISMGFREVYKSLRSMGYKVEAGLYSSKETGGGHVRKRLFILAELEYTKDRNESNDQKSQRFEEALPVFSRSGFDVVNSNGNADCNFTKKIQSTAGEIKKEAWLQNGKWCWSKSCTTDSQLANNNSTGIREMESWTKPESAFRSGKRMPIAPPGDLQYIWEESRENSKGVLKSRLGLSADGYDYRTDLLRALGNGVDPWVACKAWKDLNRKMSITNHLATRKKLLP